MLKIRFLLIILYIIVYCQGQLVIKNEGPCSCDLSTDTCDINCCCDSKCTTAQIATFTCDDNYIKPAGLICFPQTLLFRNNTNFNVQIDGDKYCVYNDNYTNRNYYYKPTEISSKEILTKETDNSSPGFTYAFSVASINKASYQVGDAIITYIPDKFIGQLPISSRSSQGACYMNSAVYYSKSVNFQCSVTSVSSCDQMPFIKDYYESTLLVLINTSILFKNVNSSNLPISSYVKINCTGACDPSLVPTLDGDNCKNVVTNVEYEITIDTTKILKVYLNMTTSTVPIGTPFDQRFIVNFVQSVPVSAATATPVTLSGNPGYLDGYPVRTVLESVTSTSTDYSITEKLSILNSGECKSDNLLTIQFGKNMNSECYITINSNSDINSLINAVLNPILPGLIGPFGNTVKGNKSNLVQVLSRNTNADSTTSTITNLNITGYSIDIIYARNGTLTKPQNKIIGVRKTYLYSTSKIVSNKMWLTNSVNFYDYSQTQFSLNQLVQNAKSHRSVRQFFYLFYAEANQAITWNNNYLIILITLIVSYIITD